MFAEIERLHVKAGRTIHKIPRNVSDFDVLDYHSMFFPSFSLGESSPRDLQIIFCSWVIETTLNLININSCILL